MSSFSWGVPDSGKSKAQAISSIIDEEEEKKASKLLSLSISGAIPSSTEDEKLQLAMALAISASLSEGTPESMSVGKTDNTEEDNEGAPSGSTDEEKSLALARALAAGDHSPAEDESLALAHALAAQDKLEFEEFQRRNSNNGDKNRKVQVEFFRGSAVRSTSKDEDVPERFGADDAERYEILYGGKQEAEEDEEVYKMNGLTNRGGKYMRIGDKVVNTESGEVVSKHDSKLKMASNAQKLQLGKEGNIGNSAYNQLKRDIGKGRSKGVAAHGHGRAEAIGGGKTHTGALDAASLQVIRKAIDKSIIDACHGAVREGKEGLILYAEGSGGVQAADEDDERGPFVPPYTPKDVCVKVYKRIVAFKNRGDYVDGDARYYKKRFSDVDKRDQLTLWAEKEYRNLTRAFLGGVACPRPVTTKENVCMMTFFGEDGFPSPTLKEVADLGFINVSEKRLKKYFCEIIVGIRRMWWCAQLVHGDLSEYNLLLCDSKKIRDQVRSEIDTNIEDDTSMEVGKRRIVIIDFAQAVQREHPKARDLLERDVARVGDFFGQFVETPEASALMTIVLEREEGEEEEDEDEGGGEMDWVAIQKEWRKEGDVGGDEEECEDDDFVNIERETMSVREESRKYTKKTKIDDKKCFDKVMKFLV